MNFGLQSTLAKKISRRYGQALFNLALEKNAVEETLADIVLLGETLKKSSDLTDFVHDPHVLPELSEKVISAIFKDQVRPLTYDFLLLLIRKGRLLILPVVLEAFMALYHQYHRITKIMITSAEALTTQQVDNICKRLQSRHKHEYFAETAVDPQLIGGFQIKSGDEVLDFSMKNQLENFRRQVINA